MYRCVATVQDDGVSVAVEQITDTGSILPKIVYESVNQLPADIRDKLNQLKWVQENDQDFHDGLGTRVGKDIFWIC